MSDTQVDPLKVRINKGRLSFPHLFKPHAMEEGQEAKYSCALLLDPKTKEGAAAIRDIQKAIEHAANAFFKGKIPSGLKFCLRDGDEKADIDGYAGMMFVPASSKRRPPVVDKHVTPVYEDDGTVYAGCYVNAVVKLWVQDNKFGKRVNAEILTVQFAGDGESFGAPVVNPEEEFSPVDDDGEEEPAPRSPGGLFGGAPKKSGLFG